MGWTNRYVGGESKDGYVVHDTWDGSNGKTIERHSSKEKAMDRVVELNKPYVDASKNAKRG